MQMIRLALASTLSLAAAGCVTTAPKQGETLAAMQKPEIPQRSCQQVTADAILISNRSTMVAGIKARPIQESASDVSEVPWHVPPAGTDPILSELMGYIRTEADTLKCPLVFNDGQQVDPGLANLIPVALPEPAAPPAVTPPNAPSKAPIPATAAAKDPGNLPSATKATAAPAPKDKPGAKPTRPPEATKAVAKPTPSKPPMPGKPPVAPAKPKTA